MKRVLLTTILAGILLIPIPSVSKSKERFADGLSLAVYYSVKPSNFHPIVSLNRSIRNSRANKSFKSVKRSKTLKSVKTTVKTRSVIYASTVLGARKYALAKIGAKQFSCVDKLWNKESNWNPTSYWASTGAYGIPQAVPGNKMASKGADWKTNPLTQVKWGLYYIKERYGTPCNAWAHSIKFNWY